MNGQKTTEWFNPRSQIKHYFSTRISSLKIPTNTRSTNPFRVLQKLNRHQWFMFLIGFLGWMWDPFDFMAISLSLTDIAKEFDVTYSEASWGLTVTLMFRAVGALISGTLSDRYGRKWPMIACLSAMVIVELGTGFATCFSQFIVLRAIFGMTMGGVFAPAASTALEDLPYEARGIFSGLFQQGYSVGYLLAAVFYRALVPTTDQGWRSLFWFAAVPPMLVVALRLFLPDTNQFLVQKAERDTRHKRGLSHASIGSQKAGIRALASDFKAAIKPNWITLCYMALLMTFIQASGHGAQDLYPTFLKAQVGQSETNTTLVISIGEIGELIGGIIGGCVSSILGRRLTMICICFFGAAVVPAYVGLRDLTIIAPFFFESFFIGCLFGPVPVHLMELAPPTFRTLAVGFTYQFGNLAASTIAVTESKSGAEHPLPPAADGTKRFDYGTVIGMFTGIGWALVLLLLLLGPEMSQEEREKMRLEAEALEDERRNGGNLAGLGMQRAGKERDSAAKSLSEVTCDTESSCSVKVEMNV